MHRGGVAANRVGPAAGQQQRRRQLFSGARVGAGRPSPRRLACTGCSAVQDSSTNGAELDASRSVKVPSTRWRNLDQIDRAYAISMSEAERFLPKRPVHATLFERMGNAASKSMREFDMRFALFALVGVLAACSYAGGLWTRMGPGVSAWFATRAAPLMLVWAAFTATPTSPLYGLTSDVIATYAGIATVLWMMVGSGGRKSKTVVVSQNLPLSINLGCYRIIRAFTYVLSEHYAANGRALAADVVRALRPPLCQMLCAVLWAALFVLILGLVPDTVAFEYSGLLSPLRHLDLNGDGTLTGAEFTHNLLIVCAKGLAATVTAILGGFVLGIEGEVVRRTFPPESRSKAVQSEIDFASSLFHIVVNTLVIISILDAVGVPTGTLLALGGVSGVAIGFGAQSTMTNLFSAVTILLNSRFRAGDYVKLNDGQLTGTVEKIGWFSTQLIDDDGFHITLANKDVVETPMINISRREFWAVNGDFAVECPYERVKPIQSAVHDACCTYPIGLRDEESMNWTGCWYEGTTAGADRASSANPQTLHRFSFSVSLDPAISRPMLLTHKSDLLMYIGDIIVAQGGKLLSCDSGANFKEAAATPTPSALRE